MSLNNTRSGGMEQATTVTNGSVWPQINSMDRRSNNNMSAGKISKGGVQKQLTGNIRAGCDSDSLDDLDYTKKTGDNSKTHRDTNSNLFKTLHLQVPDDFPG